MDRPIMFWKARITFTFSFIDLSATLLHQPEITRLQELLEVCEVRVKENDPEEANEEGHVVVLLQILQIRVLRLLRPVVACPH